MFRFFKKHQGSNLFKSSRRRRKSSSSTGGHNSRLKFEALEPRLVLDSTLLDLQPVALSVDIATSQPVVPLTESAPVSLPKQMEYLNRGIVAVNKDAGSVYVGWRLLGTDPGDIAFNLYRSANGGAAVKLNGSPLTTTTDFVDTTAIHTQTNAYYVRPVIDSVEQDPSETFTLAADTPVQQFLSVPLQIPAGGTSPDGETYTYSANDCSVGDLDGDGQYEIIVKWDPSNAKDSASAGYTGNVYLDAYEMNGTRLWRIDLGINIRAGAHYTQFMVYDLDGDGRAEVACKTAPGTRDGLNQQVYLPGDDPDFDWRGNGIDRDLNGDGRIDQEGRIVAGPEYLTIFDGQTGAELATTNYVPTEGPVTDWGDNYGNRADRYLATVAYLDGVRPSLVMCQGYYSGQSSYPTAQFYLVAWNWRDGGLTQLWTTHAAYAQDNYYLGDYVGQGNHNLSVGDVDGDGKDEIIYGACAFDDDGSGLYNTGLGHGDAIHLGDLDPDRPGLEVFDVHEPYPCAAGMEFRDAATGELIWGKASTGDVGRGVSDDIYAGTYGAEAWSGTGGTPGYLFDRYGNIVIDPSTGNPAHIPSSVNFLVWWDSDHVRELLDSNHIDKYGLSSDTRLLTASECSSNNGTKATPALSADILGDWREEVIWRTTDNSALHIYTTTNPATDRIYTLMHDLQYRESIAWQNTAYNQPPHTSFYLGDGMDAPPTPNIYLATADLVPPEAPTDLTATVISAGQIDLSWTASAGAVGYLIERADYSGGSFLAVGSVIGGTSFSDMSVTDGGMYYYIVSAVNTSGQSDKSTEASASIPIISPWTAQDIGNVGIPGRSTYDDGVFTLKGSSLDSGTGDAFRLVSQNISGDGSFIVKVQSLDPQVGSGGITFRKSTAADSAFASLTLNIDNKIYFNYRDTDGGAISSSSISSVHSPKWLQLTRVGNNFTAYYSSDGLDWTQIGASQTITMPTSVLGGMMTYSIGSTELGVATYSDVSVLAPGTNAAPTVATTASASPSTVTSTTTNLSVLGADDLGQGNLIYTWATIGTPPAPVSFSINGNNTAKNTVATFTHDGTYNFRVTITDAAGLTVTSDTSATVVLTLTSTSVSPGPVMINSGATQQFTAVGLDQFGSPMAQQPPSFTWSLLNGAGTLSATGLFTAPSVSQTTVVQATSGSASGTAIATVLVGSLFTTNTDINANNPPGSGTYNAGTYTVAGEGADIGGTADQFHYYYKSSSGDMTVIARVVSIGNTNASAKAGIMIRNGTAVGARNAFIAVTPGSGVTYQTRTSTNGSTSSTTQTGYTAPYWIKLVRSGSNFTAYRSPDGVNWTQVGSTVSVSSTTLVGLAVTSHADGTLCTATFDNVSITGANTAPTVATAASAVPNPATGTTTNLSALGSDNGGEANLTYTWATTGTPPAPVNFSVNGNNAAKNAVATFTKPGTYNFQVTIRDTASLSVTSSTSVVVYSTITGRKIFYNNSKFDAHAGFLSGDPAANLYDDNAIATDKYARLPGETATYANYTSFSRGINGIMIDIQNLAGTPNIGNYTQFFTFKVGNNGDIGNWSAAPAPIAVECRDVSGSTRVTIIWDEGAIENQWLQATVLANVNTGLAVADVFYFGNLAGESCDNATVTIADENAALNNRTGFTLASITNNADYNRDRQVNATDALIARHNANTTLWTLSGPLAAEDTLHPLTMLMSEPVAALIVTPSAISVAGSNGLVSASSNTHAADVSITKTSFVPYISFEFHQVSRPLSSTLTTGKGLGDRNIKPMAVFVSSSEEIKRHTQQRENAAVDKALFHDVVLSQTKNSKAAESETNWSKNNLNDEMIRTIIKDQISKKTKPTKSAIDAFLAAYR